MHILHCSFGSTETTCVCNLLYIIYFELLNLVLPVQLNFLNERTLLPYPRLYIARAFVHSTWLNLFLICQAVKQLNNNHGIKE